MEKQKSNAKKRLGLIGKNIDYSFSRTFFTEKFHRENIDTYSYENFDLATINLLPDLLKDPSIIGMNVTIPYKQEVIPYLDQIEGDAATIGAVNTIRRDEKGRTIGYNTDTYGFEKALLDMLPSLPECALILGTGGAAKAVAFVLAKNNIKATYVSRNAKKDVLSYKDLDTSLLSSHKLIINCSPVGTFPNVEEAPAIPYAFLGTTHSLFDLIYNPEKTRFLQEGEQRGARIQNGRAMLEYQAEKSWEIWGQKP
jgi:shikimate dehydrogenase